MDLASLKIIFAVIILAIAVAAGWIPFRKKLLTLDGRDFPRGEALASGVFLGAGLIHMLGDSSHNFNAMGVTYPLAFLLAGISFLTLLYLEHLSGEFREHQNAQSPSIAILAVIMLSVHSLFEGAALGLSKNFSTTLLIFIAIIAHKWAASFSLAVQINKSALRWKEGLLYFAIFCIIGPLGILLGDSINQLSSLHNFWQPALTAIAAGTFLYIGTLHGLKRSVMVERCCNLHDFSYVIFGFVLMAVVAIWT